VNRAAFERALPDHPMSLTSRILNHFFPKTPDGPVPWRGTESSVYGCRAPDSALSLHDISEGLRYQTERTATGGRMTWRDVHAKYLDRRVMVFRRAWCETPNPDGTKPWDFVVKAYRSEDGWSCFRLHTARRSWHWTKYEPTPEDMNADDWSIRILRITGGKQIFVELPVRAAGVEPPGDPQVEALVARYVAAARELDHATRDANSAETRKHLAMMDCFRLRAVVLRKELTRLEFDLALLLGDRSAHAAGDDQTGGRPYSLDGVSCPM